MTKKKRYLTLGEVSKKLGLSKPAVLKAIHSGRLKGKRATISIKTKVWQISVESVDHFVISESHRERGKNS